MESTRAARGAAGAAELRRLGAALKFIGAAEMRRPGAAELRRPGAALESTGAAEAWNLLEFTRAARGADGAAEGKKRREADVCNSDAVTEGACLEHGADAAGSERACPDAGVLGERLAVSHARAESMHKYECRSDLMDPTQSHANPDVSECKEC